MSSSREGQAFAASMRTHRHEGIEKSVVPRKVKRVISVSRFLAKGLGAPGGPTAKRRQAKSLSETFRIGRGLAFSKASSRSTVNESAGKAIHGFTNSTPAARAALFKSLSNAARGNR
jgi:hypothetical protein